MPALTVSALPADILLYLISFLDHSADVRALALLSPTLHALIHANDLVAKTQYRSLRISSLRDVTNAFTTLLAILRNPKLGSYVRHIEMDIPIRSPLSYLPRKHDRSLGEADMQLLRRAINKAGFTAHSEDRLLNMLMQEITPARDWGYLTYYEFVPLLKTPRSTQPNSPTQQRIRRVRKIHLYRPGHHHAPRRLLSPLDLLGHLTPLLGIHLFPA